MNRYYPAGVIFHNTILGLPVYEEDTVISLIYFMFLTALLFFKL